MTCLRDHTPACRVPLLLEPLESRNLLSAGTFAVAAGIVHSPENYGNFVTSLYENYLGRPPDPAGFTDWLGQLEQGRSPEEVEAGVVASPEYILEHGNDAALWLTGLYEDLLGREPDVEVDLAEIPVQPGDYLLLCSDGLTRMVSELTLARTIDELRDPQSICDALIHAANRNGGADNITVIVVEVTGSWWRQLSTRWRRKVKRGNDGETHSGV